MSTHPTPDEPVLDTSIGGAADRAWFAEQRARIHAAPQATHVPCCSSHNVHMDCETYRRTHFVEVGNCCDAWAMDHPAAAPVPQGTPPIDSPRPTVTTSITSEPPYRYQDTPDTVTVSTPTRDEVVEDWASTWDGVDRTPLQHCGRCGISRPFLGVVCSSCGWKNHLMPEQDTEDADYRLLADHIIALTNPPEDDAAEVAILMGVITRLRDFVITLPCECPADEMGVDFGEEDACDACRVLGRFNRKDVTR